MEIHDPIWRDIEIDEEMTNIINTPCFKRLKYVSQSQSFSSTYKTGHSRFTHSIGAMHCVRKMASKLSQKYPDIIDKDEITNIQEATLLHDIAHGPFSHCFDETVYCKIYDSSKGHDEHRFTLLPHLSDVLTDTTAIANIWNGRNVIGNALLSGPFGADRMDFIQRDCFFAGIHDLGFDPLKIIESVELSRNQDTDMFILTYPENIMNDLIQMLLRRFDLYENLYRHSSSLVAQALVRKILCSCTVPLKLIERTMDFGSFIHLTDEHILSDAESIVPDLVTMWRRQNGPTLFTSCPPTGNYEPFDVRSIHLLDKDKFKYIKLDNNAPIYDYISNIIPDRITGGERLYVKT